jgi:hypothetical protein
LTAQRGQAEGRRAMNADRCEILESKNAVCGKIVLDKTRGPIQGDGLRDNLIRWIALSYAVDHSTISRLRAQQAAETV